MNAIYGPQSQLALPRYTESPNDSLGTVSSAPQPNPAYNSLVYRGTIIILVLLDIVYVPLLIFYLFSLIARRFHDTEKSGWYWLLSLIPIVGEFVGLYLTFWPGDSVVNKYGAMPLPRIDIKHDILKLG